MGVLDFLKKIGVIQVGGGAAVYKKATERPGYLDDNDYGGNDNRKPAPEDKSASEPVESRDD
ncbi:MAG: hypothetical protein IPL47_15080 [Phyllobacteriaceae bacterium]|nr:hypothetical protein [Phyllobacteriaceae bacterium]